MPTKEQVRHYMHQRQAEKLPLPTTDEIRRRLGWNLIVDSRIKGRVRK